MLVAVVLQLFLVDQVVLADLAEDLDQSIALRVNFDRLVGILGEGKLLLLLFLVVTQRFLEGFGFDVDDCVADIFVRLLQLRRACSVILLNAFALPHWMETSSKMLATEQLLMRNAK